MRSASVLAAALLLAGCLGAEPTPGPATPSEGPGASGKAFELVRCTGPIFVTEQPAERVQAHLPEGYVAESTTGIVTNNPHLQGLDCPDVLVDGVSQGNVQLAFSGTLLDVANGFEKEPGTEFYMFELFLDVAAHPALAARLAARGWNVIDADVSVQPTQVDITAESVSYSFVTPSDPEPADFDAGIERFHRGDPALVLSFETQLLGQFVGGGPLTARGGFFGDLAGEASLLAGVTQAVALQGVVLIGPPG